MPASIAAASEWGIIFMSRANMPVMPQSTIRQWQRNKDANRLGERDPLQTADQQRRAGVDQAVRMGTFRQTVRARVLMPIPDLRRSSSQRFAQHRRLPPPLPAR